MIRKDSSMKFDALHWFTLAYSASVLTCWLLTWWVPAIIGTGYVCWFLINGWRPWSPGFK